MFRLIADYFVYYFLYTYRFVIIPYAHDEFELTKVGNKKSPQRWMQCGFCFDCHMRPAVAFIYLERYRDEKIVESAKVFVREAINFALSNVINGTELKNTVKFDVMRRLTSMRIIIGFPEEILSSQKNEEFYDELSLSGNESYFEACREFHKHHHKLENERKKTYRRRLDEITLKSEVEFIAQDNVLCKNVLASSIKNFIYISVLLKLFLQFAFNILGIIRIDLDSSTLQLYSLTFCKLYEMA